MACSSQGASTSACHRPERHRQARELAHHVVAELGQGVDALAPEGALLVGVGAGPAGVLDDDDEVVGPGEPPARRPRSWSGWVISSNSRSRSCRARSTSADGRDPSEAPIGRTPRKRGAAICRSMSATASATESVGGRPPTMASGWPSASARRSSSSVSSIGVAAGGGGDVDELLDVPARRLGQVGGDVEAAGHPGDVAHVQLRLVRREVRVPVGAGRVPQVHVGIDDAGGPRVIGCVRGHRGGADLSERVVEPPGHLGPAEGDAADRPRVAAQAEPARADDQLGTGERRRPRGGTTRWAASSPAA